MSERGREIACFCACHVILGWEISSDHGTRTMETPNQQSDNVMSSNRRISRELTDWTDTRSNGGLHNGSRLRSRFGAAAATSNSSEETMTPTLAHKLKHNKSILALAVSTDTLFAGTEGGEILVRSCLL